MSDKIVLGSFVAISFIIFASGIDRTHNNCGYQSKTIVEKYNNATKCMRNDNH